MLKRILVILANIKKALSSARFFKTTPEINQTIACIKIKHEEFDLRHDSLNTGTVFSFIKSCAGNKSNNDVYKNNTRGV